MRHDAVDRHSALSPFSEFDPRAKLLGVLTFVIFISLVQGWVPLFVSACFMMCMLALSGIPVIHVARRYAVALPFIAFAALTLLLTSGTEQALAMFLRISASVLALVLLVTTTLFFDLLKGLQRLHVPEMMVSMLMFTYRYIFVFGEELDRMKLARRAKAYRPGSSLLHGNTMRVISNTAGMVLVRAYERGLRVQDSLRARKFDGRIRTQTELRIRARDAGFCIAMVLIPVLSLCFQWGLLA